MIFNAHNLTLTPQKVRLNSGKVITGVRRCGKSSLMRIIADDLQDKRTYVTEVVREIFQKDIYRRIKTKNRASFDLVKN